MKGHTHKQLGALYEPPALEIQGGPLKWIFWLNYKCIIKIRVMPMVEL